MLVKFYVGSEKRPAILLRGREMVTVGSSRRANYTIPDSQLADIQLELSTDDTSCQLKNVGGNGPGVLINGIASSQAVLQDGDIISVGATQLRVDFEQKPELDSAVPTLPYTLSDVGDGIARYTGVLDDDSRQLLVAAMGQPQQAMLAANFKRAALPLPNGLAEEADLLKSAPESIRQTDSLHLLSADDLIGEESSPSDHRAHQLWETFQTLSQQDAATFLLATLSCEELAAAIKMHVGWFSRPSTLQTFFMSGSPELRKSLIKNVRAALLISGGSQWTMYANREQASSWQELGLPNPPN